MSSKGPSTEKREGTGIFLSELGDRGDSPGIRPLKFRDKIDFIGWNHSRD